jgi:nucleoside 2-deoxyribosyltransferase
VQSLERDGHTILTKHLLEESVDSAEAALSEQAVYQRDVEWLDSCDVLIADASGSSYGVGFEVGYVLARSERTAQRVVLLYRADRRHQISRLIVGNTHRHCTTIGYNSPEEAIAGVSRALQAKA